MKFKEFKKRLKHSLVDEIKLNVPKLDNSVISSFDFGVHPWFGYFELSFITEKEVNEDIAVKYDIASCWFYNINDFQINEESGLFPLGKYMEAKFEKIKTFKYDMFFQVSAEIVNSAEIQNSLKLLNLSSNFYCSVYDPDDSKYRNYCTGYKNGWFENTSIVRLLIKWKNFGD